MGASLSRRHVLGVGLGALTRDAVQHALGRFRPRSAWNVGLGDPEISADFIILTT